MERGDIATYDRPERACIFEGLLAEPPSRLKSFFKKEENAETSLKKWKANELPLKSLIDSTNRLGIHTQVFTLLGLEMEEPVYQWLLRKGVSCSVHAYDSLEEAIQDFKYNRSLNIIFVQDQEMALDIGLRAKVVSPTIAWSN